MLAVSSWCWHDAYYHGRFSLLDLPAAAAELGFSAVELNDFILPPPRLSRLRRPLLRLSLAPDELWRYTAANLNRLRVALDAAGVTCLAWTIDSNLAVSALKWPWQQHYIRQGLNAARLLNAPMLRLTLGGRPDTPAALDNRLIGRLASIVQFSQAIYPGVTLVVENHWGISEDIGRLLAIVRRAQGQLPAGLSAHLGICFDPSNIPHPQPEHHWPALASAARHVHFKTGHSHPLNYPALFTLLRQANYQGHFTLEFEGDGNIKEGVLSSIALFKKMKRDE